MVPGSKSAPMPTTSSSPAAWASSATVSGKRHRLGGGSVGRGGTPGVCPYRQAGGARLSVPWAAMSEHPMQERLGDLIRRKEEARHAGTPRAVERQHAKGKMTARER